MSQNIIKKFKKFSYIDKEGTGIEAFSLLIPIEWIVDGKLIWNLNNPAMPAALWLKIKNPINNDELELFPNQSFFWTNNQMTLSIFPIGSYYFGSEVCPPMNAIDALKKIVIPRFRTNLSNLKIINEKNLPDLANSLKSNIEMISNTDAAKIRIEYNKNNVWIEEEIYAVIELVQYIIPSLFGQLININWFIEYLFSFKSQKGNLESLSDLFQTMIYSFKINPKWFNLYNQIINYLTQMQINQIKHVGNISKIISQTHDEISNIISESYYERQKINDKIVENFSNYIRGVENYYNPIDDKTIKLPAHYENVWTNNLGEYILSNDSNFNPNEESNQNWIKLEKKNE